MTALTSTHLPRVLTVAESYSDGRNGIEVDLKTFTALSTFGASIITAFHLQNAIHPIPSDVISSQYRAMVNGHSIDALKIGVVLPSTPVECIASLITEMHIPIVVMDTLLVTSQLSSKSLGVIREQLLPKVTVVSSTADEAAILLDCKLVSLEDMKRAAQTLYGLGAKNVLISSDTISDVLFDGVNFTVFKNCPSPDRTSSSTRSIRSAALTAFLAYGLGTKQAVEDAIAYTHSVLRRSAPLDPSLVIDQSQRALSYKSQSWMKEPCILPQSRSFVQLLKNMCTQDWYDYTHHDFVEKIGNGSLPEDSFKHYLIQDYIFLTHFARCHALAAYKSHNMTDILLAAKTTCSIGEEIVMHVAYCASWGIDVTTLSSMQEARANLAYTRFTLDCGMTGDLLDLQVALAPCLLGYGDIGSRLASSSQTNRESPYWKWIENYACDSYQEACRSGERLIDRLADEYGVWHAAIRIKKLSDIFWMATKLEIGFWDMGLGIEW